MFPSGAVPNPSSEKSNSAPPRAANFRFLMLCAREAPATAASSLFFSTINACVAASQFE
jgi:hypothetical protein